MKTHDTLIKYIKKDGDSMQLSSMMNSTAVPMSWCPCQGTCGFTCAQTCTGCDSTCADTCMGKILNY